MFHIVADSASLDGRSDRNFIRQNCRPSTPTRSCLKMTPGPPSSRTARATSSRTGARNSTAAPDTTTSMRRFRRQARLRYVARRSRTSGRPQAVSMSASTWCSSKSRGTTKSSQLCRSQVRMRLTVSDSFIEENATTTVLILLSATSSDSRSGPPNTGRPDVLSALHGVRSRKPTGRRPYSGCACRMSAIWLPTRPAPMISVECATRPLRRTQRTAA